MTTPTTLMTHDIGTILSRHERSTRRDDGRRFCRTTSRPSSFPTLQKYRDAIEEAFGEKHAILKITSGDAASLLNNLDEFDRLIGLLRSYQRPVLRTHTE